MDLEFFKYHGAGNDFIVIDNREGIFPVEGRLSKVKELCQRHFGVGSDGLILIQNDEKNDFFMEFYNPDGSQSFCGNGSRCAVMFAFHLGLVGTECTFNSIHGVNQGNIIDGGTVELNMFDVQQIEVGDEYHYMNTGSPHYNIYVDDVDGVDLIPCARSIRYNKRFAKEGTNVNVIEVLGSDSIKVRTYERGVEDETLACGTGVTACAISQLIHENKNSGRINIHTRGGELIVEIGELIGGAVRKIKLTGPAKFVFKGEVNV